MKKSVFHKLRPFIIKIIHMRERKFEYRIQENNSIEDYFADIIYSGENDVDMILDMCSTIIQTFIETYMCKILDLYQS